ncbi:MAG TPA: DUF4249 domain-containing protein [Mucilaginibacter sp.]|nr:DUF4249 domain-containing protein [Mucilaginibacter sp.]
MKKIILILILIVAVYGCKKPYNPPAIAAPGSYLVVEGVINNGTDATVIKLSRTIPLSSKTTPQPELGAEVSVENEHNESIILSDNFNNGQYSAGVLQLDNTLKYRLKIRTNSGQLYESDLVPIKNTPDIDSIVYKVQNNGVQLWVNAHDPQNNTRYYRWDFDETWKYISMITSNWKYEGGIPVYRIPYLYPDDNIHECYKTQSSHQVLLGSSAKLGQDVISMQPIDFIEAGSGKISYGYSILLRQYALTADAFTYWQVLKKNTESLGSIFDAQPSSLAGNIHNTTNAAEPVIGYVSVCTIKSKRLFIDKFNVDLFVPSYIGPPDGGSCMAGSISVDPYESFGYRLNQAVGSGDSILVAAVSPPGVPIITGYTYAPKECVDCRLKLPFGINVKPAFWPQ